MKEYIALLKGINVGGHKKVPMAKLREILTNIGFKNVKTYIQSGNVIFNSEVTSCVQIENTIKKAILDCLGFDVSVIVKTRKELKSIFDICPFSEDKKKLSYFMMLHDTPDADLIALASEIVYEGEEYKIINDCIYFFCAKGYGKAKFNANFFENKLKTFGTSRNYKTMLKLLELTA